MHGGRTAIGLSCYPFTKMVICFVHSVESGAPGNELEKNHSKGVDVLFLRKLLSHFILWRQVSAEHAYIIEHHAWQRSCPASHWKYQHQRMIRQKLNLCLEINEKMPPRDGCCMWSWYCATVWMYLRVYIYTWRANEAPLYFYKWVSRKIGDIRWCESITSAYKCTTCVGGRRCMIVFKILSRFQLVCPSTVINARQFLSEDR